MYDALQEYYNILAIAPNHDENQLDEQTLTQFLTLEKLLTSQLGRYGVDTIGDLEDKLIPHST